MPSGVYKRTKKVGGWKLSKEIRKRMSLVLIGNKRKKGYKLTKEQKRNIGLGCTGNKSYMWNEKNPSYRAVHKWLRKYFNQEKEKCEFCGSTKNLQWAKKTRCKYRRKGKSFMVLCAKCHTNYDWSAKKKPRATKKLNQILGNN